MKLIIISGPTSAGKDAVIGELLKELEQDYPGKVSEAQYFKTRSRRNDEKDSPYFVSKEKFAEMKKNGEIRDPFWGKVSDYEVGYSEKEFEKTEIEIVNI